MASDRKEEENHVQTAVRIPESWMERLDKIAEQMSRPGMRVTRAEALRLSAIHGIEYFEAEGKKKR